MAQLIHELVLEGATRAPGAPALLHAGVTQDYAALAATLAAVAAGLAGLGAGSGAAVAVWLDPGLEAVQALLGAAGAGAVMVPLHPACSAARAAALLHACGARVLVTSGERLARLAPVLAHCPELRAVVTTGGGGAAPAWQVRVGWDELMDAGAGPCTGAPPGLAALLYRPGVARPQQLSHQHLLSAAASSARCLALAPGDRVLAALPLSLDFGLNQLAATFAGRAAMLAGGWRMRELRRAAAGAQATVLVASPAAWAALARCDWHGAPLRCAVSAGGAMPRASAGALRRALPGARICMLYGLPDAFRATSLAPARPGGANDSIRTSGHRVSPHALEQVVYGTGLVEEAAAVGVAHPVLGQVIAVLATPRRGARLDSSILFGACRARLPGYMLPTMIDVRRAPLPRGPNGAIDRALLAGELAPLFAEATP